MLAKQQFWTPSPDDGYDDFDDNVPSLVPIFDPAFATTPAPVITSTITPIDTACEHGSSSIITPIAPMPSNPLRNNADDIHKAISSSPEAPEIRGDIGTLGIHDWESLSAPRRVAAVRRWIIQVTHEYGPVEQWGEDFSQMWSAAKHRDPPAVCEWLQEAKRRIKMGRSALSYLECVMEGELSPCVEEWRDLYFQSHQLASLLWRAVLGLQHRLDTAFSEQAGT